MANKTDSLKQYVSLRQSLLNEKKTLEVRLQAINSALNSASKTTSAITVAGIEAPVKKKRKMSAAGRARIVAAQKARWAKVKAGKK